MARRRLAAELDQVEHQACTSVLRLLPRSASPGRPTPPPPTADAAWLRGQYRARAPTSFASHRAVSTAWRRDLRRVEGDDDPCERRPVELLSACFVVQREAKIWADTLDRSTREAFIPLNNNGRLGRFLFRELWLTHCAAMAGSPDSGLLDLEPDRHRRAQRDAARSVMAARREHGHARSSVAGPDGNGPAVFLLRARPPAYNRWGAFSREQRDDTHRQPSHRALCRPPGSGRSMLCISFAGCFCVSRLVADPLRHHPPTPPHAP